MTNVHAQVVSSVVNMVQCLSPQVVVPELCSFIYVGDAIVPVYVLASWALWAVQYRTSLDGIGSCQSLLRLSAT